MGNQPLRRTGPTKGRLFRYHPILWMGLIGVGFSLLLFAVLREWEWRQIEPGMRLTWQPWIVMAVSLAITVVGNSFIYVVIRRSLRNEQKISKQADQCRLAEADAREYATALEEANKVLERCSATAQAASRSKSEFLANMSHEIRTPLTAILGYADILLGAIPRELDEQRQAVATIKRNGGYLLAIINDILDLSKIEAGRLEVDRIACLPRKLLTELKSLMSAGAEAKGLTFTLEFDGAVPEAVLTDPVRLRQILINLIGNAIKFTDSGGIRVTARLRTYSSPEPMLEIEVADTGIGMNDFQLSRLFQPFAQADGSTTRQFGGTGLGLAISKRLAGMLGGNIAVRSSPGEGSAFSVTVAAGLLDGAAFDGEATESAESDSSDSVEPMRIEGRVLLAEDGPDNQRLISYVLRKAGADVSIVENGREAIEAMQPSNDGRAPGEWPFDVVLMDIQMPVMDGYEATRRLRKTGFRGPIIALTAYAMPRDIQQCLEAGCDLHLAKPINLDTLLQAVSRSMHRRASTPAKRNEY